MKVPLIILLLNIVQSYAICSYYETITETNSRWKCNEPLENLTAIFVTDIPKSVILALDRDVLKPFKSLSYIHIGKCEIETVAPDTFIGHPVKALYLNQNKIKKIENGTLNSLNSTTTFEITFNQLDSLEANTFTGMLSLNWMSLSANKIVKIDKNAFIGLDNLEVLFLTSNRIGSLDIDTFKPLKKLTLLDVSHNQLAQLQFGIFSDLTNLQTLLLEHNKIQRLPDRIFDKLPGLSTLDVSQNQISEIQNTLFAQVLENFHVFKIYANKLKYFNATNFFVHAPKINTIELYDNPWKCAELERLWGELLKNNVFVPIPVRATKNQNVDGITCEVK